MSDKDAEEMFCSAEVVFGLEAQGKIPVIEAMLANGEDWTAIGKQIGWCRITARKYYERYAQAKQNSDEDKIEVHELLAESVEMMRGFVAKMEDSWQRNPIHEYIYFAEKHLLSTPKKKVK